MISKTINVVTFRIANQEHIKVVNQWRFLGVPILKNELYCGQIPPGWYPAPHTDPAGPPGVQMPTAQGMN